MENACIDTPSVLDYEYEPLFGSTNALPIEFVCRVPRIQDQGSDSETLMGCTRFGLTHVVNTQNKRVASETRKEYVETIAKDYWVEWVKNNPSAKTQGATLQSALDQFKKAGLITGYAKCTTVEEMKSALYRYRFIYTGSQVGDWGSVTANHVYKLRTDGRLVGHAFCIVGWNKDGWIAVNSYGEKNGYFTIPFDLTSSLFTRYAVADTNDEEAISLYKKNIMDNISIEEAKQALEAKIWNGERAKDPVTREEAAAMVFRALNK